MEVKVNSRAYAFKKTSVKNADVQRVIFQSSAGLGPHILNYLHENGILKNQIIDSFELGKVLAEYGNTLEDSYDKLCFYNAIIAVSDTNEVAPIDN